MNLDARALERLETLWPDFGQTLTAAAAGVNSNQRFAQNDGFVVCDFEISQKNPDFLHGKPDGEISQNSLKLKSSNTPPLSNLHRSKASKLEHKIDGIGRDGVLKQNVQLVHPRRPMITDGGDTKHFRTGVLEIDGRAQLIELAPSDRADVTWGKMKKSMKTLSQLLLTTTTIDNEHISRPLQRLLLAQQLALRPSPLFRFLFYRGECLLGVHLQALSTDASAAASTTFHTKISVQIKQNTILVPAARGHVPSGPDASVDHQIHGDHITFVRIVTVDRSENALPTDDHEATCPVIVVNPSGKGILPGSGYD